LLRYDFAVFGYFSDVLSEVFFPPNQEGHAALVETFAVFGGAFLMRPIGGVMMGYIGDKYGSRRALTISIFLMAFPTFAMGCLPGYERIGSLAIVLLTLVRLLQGLSVGGQLMSSLVFTLERHPKSKWGLYGSYVMAAANLGTLLGGTVAMILRRSMTEEQLHRFGWRIPFVSGILVSISGFYLRSHGEDDNQQHVHGDGATSSPQNPIRLAFSRGNIRALLATAMVTLLWSTGFYLIFVWMPVYMTDLIDNPVPNAFAVNSASLAISVCLLFPIAGWVSDSKFGRRRVMGVGGLLLGIFAPIMMFVIGKGVTATALLAQTSLGISLSLWGAPMMAWLAESFEPSARLTSVSIGYNVGQVLGGGLAPAIATELIDSFGAEVPGYYITIVAVVSLIGLCFVSPRLPAHFSLVQGEDDFDYSEDEDRVI
jgi:MHS family proline/betaine transporter-like MFS transporter